MKIHFISIGGSIMHNLAIALKRKGHAVSGSDDELFEPAKNRLEKEGILPDSNGWHPDRINKNLDVVILGMHAKADNPELTKARLLGLQIYSFPEFIYINSKDKTRIAVAGSHGKTTITSMIMHVMRKYNKRFDYLVGALVEGFDEGLKLTDDAPIIILEADEYLSSAINSEPKFLWYKPQLALISGIAWDHMNVFPTYEIYIDQFRKFIESMPEHATLIYYKGDVDLVKLVSEFDHIHKLPYDKPMYKVKNNQFVIQNMSGVEIELGLRGSHNLLNMEGAKLICNAEGISDIEFYEAIRDFKGAGKRLEKIHETENCIVFRDFAHAPSKVSATVSGIRDQYPDRKLFACLELHTYSSLNSDFIPLYRKSMLGADRRFVYINEEAVKLKRMRLLDKGEIVEAFSDPDMDVFYSMDQLIQLLKTLDYNSSVLLMMSSGNFDNLSFNSISNVLGIED
ncbi:UDP-N-acetylmuramate--L-alanine ligase [Bacteroidota bacterium]